MTIMRTFIHVEEDIWMWDIGDQLCTQMRMIITDLVMHAKEQADW
jgi:hypothetical protein